MACRKWSFSNLSHRILDFVMEDIPKYFPSLASRIKVSLIQSSDHILNTYDSKISECIILFYAILFSFTFIDAEKQFARDNINLLTNSRVIQVNPTDIVVVDKVTNQKSSISFGISYFCFVFIFILSPRYVRVGHWNRSNTSHAQSCEFDSRANK